MHASPTVYEVKEKFAAPATVTLPLYQKSITAALNCLFGLASLLFVLGLFLPAYEVVGAAIVGFALWGALRLFRKGYHARHLKRYYRSLEHRWMTSPSFLAMRDFLMLLGFESKQAAELTTSLGVRTLSDHTRSQALGYYRMTDLTGEKVITAVQVTSEWGSDALLRITAKVLPHVETV